MLDLANDIRSLSDFKRNTVELLDRLRKTRHPLVLTINGKAELVVQDAEAYQALLDRVEAIEGIQRGLADVNAGRTKPARQVFDRLRSKAWHTALTSRRTRRPSSKNCTCGSSVERRSKAPSGSTALSV